jgi:hypothetical protein
VPERFPHILNDYLATILDVRFARKSKIKALRRTIATQARIIEDQSRTSEALALFPAAARLRRMAWETRARIDARLHAGETVDVIDIIAGFLGDLPLPTDTSRKTVLISGYARVGKSIISKLICLQTPLLYIPYDEFHPIYNVADPVLRNRIERTLLEMLLARYPAGALIEGFHLINGTIASVESMATRLSRHGNMSLFLLGNAETTVAEKADALRRYQETCCCWTTTDPDWDDVSTRVEDSIAQSRMLRTLATEIDACYHDIDPTRFQESVRRISMAIMDGTAPNRARFPVDIKTKPGGRLPRPANVDVASFKAASFKIVRPLAKSVRARAKKAPSRGPLP